MQTNPQIGQFSIIEDNVTFGEHVYIGNFVHIRPNVMIGDDSEVRDYCFLAEGCSIGRNTRVYQYANVGSGVRIGDNCFIGARVMLANDRKIAWPKQSPDDWIKEPAIVEDNVRIGVGAIILPRVRLGTGCLVGAGSVVVYDVPEGATVMGIPARIHAGNNS